MKRTINKVAVVGSGIMGSGIACHFANIGVEVLLLDIVPNSLHEIEEKKGLTLDNKTVRNRIVNDSLANALKSNPSPIYSQRFASRITTGNTTDDIAKISTVDWIIEVVVERLDIAHIAAGPIGHQLSNLSKADFSTGASVSAMLSWVSGVAIRSLRISSMALCSA